MTTTTPVKKEEIIPDWVSCDHHYDKCSKCTPQSSLMSTLREGINWLFDHDRDSYFKLKEITNSLQEQEKKI